MPIRAGHALLSLPASSPLLLRRCPWLQQAQPCVCQSIPGVSQHCSSSSAVSLAGCEPRERLRGCAAHSQRLSAVLRQDGLVSCVPPEHTEFSLSALQEHFQSALAPRTLLAGALGGDPAPGSVVVFASCCQRHAHRAEQPQQEKRILLTWF